MTSYEKEVCNMKKTLAGIGALLLVVLLSSCLSFDSFFPLAEPPADEQVSMLVLEAGQREDDGSSRALFNANATGWAPWVEDEWGELVPSEHLTLKRV